MVGPHLVFLVNVCVCVCEREREHRAGLRIDTWGIQSHKSLGCSCDISCLFISPLRWGDVTVLQLYHLLFVFLIINGTLHAGSVCTAVSCIRSLSFTHSLAHSLSLPFPRDKEAFISNTCI